MKSSTPHSARRFFYERLSISDATTRSGKVGAKRIGLVVWEPQIGTMDAVALEMRLRRRFIGLATRSLRGAPGLRPVVTRIEMEQVGARVQAWVFGSLEVDG